jgi:hypothetical protein
MNRSTGTRLTDQPTGCAASAVGRIPGAVAADRGCKRGGTGRGAVAVLSRLLCGTPLLKPEARLFKTRLHSR